MQTATINVKYVNAPKPNRKTGSVKTDAGVYYNVFMSDLPQFRAGGTYTVDYTTNDDGYHTIKKIHGAESPAAASPGFNAVAGTGGADRNEFIYVCGIVNAAVRAGSIDPRAPTEVLSVTRAAREAFAVEFKE